MRFRKLESIWVALLGKTVDDRTARITESHDLGALVKCLAGSIIDGLAYDLHFLVGHDLDNLAVATRYEEA